MVTVICIAYNHQQYIAQAIQSVWQQSYKPIQLIVANDGSSDATDLQIRRLKEQKDFLYLPNPCNMGYCKTFNHALSYAEGDFIVDLAGDDVLLPDRIERQVRLFALHQVGVVYSNCLLIDEQGQTVGSFHALKRGKLIPKPLSGKIFPQVLGLNFISTPTMMIGREVLDYTGGYDESLLFEDFDFWVKSSKRFEYYYDNQITTQKRILSNSLSAQFYRPKREAHFTSLAKVLYREADVKHGLFASKTLIYYLRLALITENFSSAKRFFVLCNKYEIRSFEIYVWRLIFRYKIRLYYFYQMYRKIKGHLFTGGLLCW